MIVSYKHKFMFLHCRKTGGTSIKVTLCPYLGSGDIIIGGISDCIKHGNWPPATMIYKGIKSSRGSIFLNLLSREKIAKSLNSNIKKYYKFLGIQPEHADASIVKRFFLSEWDDFYKFCVVRNPFEKVASEYFWKTRNKKQAPSFSEFVEGLFQSKSTHEEFLPRKPFNWTIYTIDDKVVVNKVLRYENLISDFAEVAKYLNIPLEKQIASAKSGYRPKNKQPKWYRTLYTKDDIFMVESLYKNELDCFNYRF